MNLKVSHSDFSYKMNDIPTEENCFIRFDHTIDADSLPIQFNYPFNYEPHPLCRLAVQELQHHLETQTDWEHEFGIEARVEGTNIGKMFGILLVRNQQNEIGYLAAFSGKLAGKNNHPLFVPPIVDLLQENSFYRIGEKEISAINHRIAQLEALDEYHLAKDEYQSVKKQSDLELELYRVAMKEAKQNRNNTRDIAKQTLSESLYTSLQENLKNESLKWQYDYKILAKEYSEKLTSAEAKLNVYLNEITTLKEERKTKSALLQQQMFDLYQFLNAKGETKNVCDIFLETDQKIPPAGAGDCAAPKLLQYAYQHSMHPIAMAEFWWGQSAHSEIRKHGCFYPACRGKCEPILGHMLEGLNVAINPVLIKQMEEVLPEIIFDDQSIVIINKPPEYLSVPGKKNADSVFDFIKRTFPESTGPLIVHRLDMSTSGLMVVAKTMEAYVNLQKQFLNRSIKKRYVALLEGLVADDEGCIELPLRVDLENRPHQMVCNEYGKPAITQWKVLERNNNRTRIQFIPITGRTHQLRVHASHPLGLNCPIVGDDLYGERADRLYLHAYYLAFTHPMKKKEMNFILDAAF
jgi:tRNA pseudouridine32 synthase/23S rRNA pseudouridine746 synthase